MTPKPSEKVGSEALTSGQAATNQRRRWKLVSLLLALLLAVVAIAIAYTIDLRKAERMAARAELDDQVVIAPALCDKWVAKFEEHGFIQFWPQPHVAAVDFQKWNTLPIDKKRIFAAAVRCRYLRGKMHREGANGYIVIRSYLSDNLLATAVRAGVHLHEHDR